MIPVRSLALNSVTTVTLGNIIFARRRMPGDMQSIRPLSPLMVYEHPENEWKSLGVVSLTVQTPTSSSFTPRETQPPPPPSRWRTPEFLFYGVAFLIVVPYMVKVPYDISNESNPNFYKILPRLKEGWLFGRHVDNSDAQYRSFRSNIPSLLALSTVHLISGRLYTRIARSISTGPEKSASGDPPAPSRIPFLLVFSLLMLAGLHGTSALKIVAILAANYWISMLKIPALTWVFNGVVLFTSNWYEGFQFGSVHGALASLDGLPGFYPRWHISFNITMLRLLSFNMDYYWASKGTLSTEPSDNMTHKQRISISHPLESYSFTNFLVYALYPALYIAGPIIGFNDFMWQLRRPQRTNGSNRIPFPTAYALRFIACLLTLEIILHMMYVVAIKDARAWHGLSPLQLSMVGFWNLIVVWMKLLIPWRFFRLWALADGIDPPENMVRCMANNYSALGFWRSWHRSYNLWIIRYIYIPLGGSTNVLRNTLIVFSFVALWHDLSFKLLAWGWLVSLFVVPEVLARSIVSRSKFGDRVWYRHACALGGVGNVLLMMGANLVGFVIGLDGMRYFLSELIGSWQGIRFLFAACVCLFIAVQVMFEYREEEARRGIYRRC
ncbi:Glycerol uptake protein 1 OS=Saccharomyces cerevisiae (strain ATCC 204508 / S288c) GN=GUP1 PE=1 SV=1 [Rhizoctonia solani AG-1 IB]|uniref:Glycerol uptake protein 1 n=1 Tax=Thanatephorus cucumeris (strain AG1-IB / isolate 7/3/14) TaxID=1108050 RepID=A0A0B7FI25_THACB|nr:Glycerol uptake protein 1 OS=Saccharomyces cerevisiae (strain ATCC 204508 / S288c) GN=GUP1 PE=1 SV=1 [Rhizoctonia solani AG-1 IB]